MTADERRFVAAAGTTFAYREAGTGPLAVLLHGFGTDGRLWRHVLDRVGATRRCVAVDLRGAGGTPPAAEAVPLERHADDVAALIATFGEDTADVVGFSMGGFVLLALLERHPHVVRSAGFVGTRANADDASAAAGRDTLIRTLLERGRGAAYLQLLPKLIGPDASEQTRAQLRTMLEEQPYEGLVAALRAIRERPDRLSVIAGVDMPVLVVAGEQDAFAPLPLTSAVADAAAGGRLEVIPGVGHTVPLERADELARLVTEFWDGTEDAT